MRLNLSLLSRVLAQPWAIDRAQLALLTQLVISGENLRPRVIEPHAGCFEETESAARPLTPLAGYITFSSAATVASQSLPPPPPDTTVILAWGVLGRAWTPDEKYYLDAIDVDDIVTAITTAPASDKIVIWFRSPGGISTGIPETAAALRALGKSRLIVAFTDDMACSAAYWLAAQCASIYSTPTASLGSIGVYISFYDWCDYLKNAGIKLELFKAGEKKGVGIMGNPLADGDREDLQGRVEETYRIFTSDVTRNRSIAKPIMQGQSLQGRAAMDANLCDAFHPSASAFLTALAKGRLRS